MKQQRRTNEKYTLEINDKMAIVKFGTTNKITPIVVYISLGTWIYPNTTGNHKQYLIDLENTVRKSIKTNILNDGLFCERYLLDYDICLDSFRVDSKRFLSIEIFLKQNSTTILSMKELLPSLTDRTSKLVDELVDDLESNNFTVTKTKK